MLLDWIAVRPTGSPLLALPPAPPSPRGAQPGGQDAGRAPPHSRPAHQAFTAQLGELDKEADLMLCEECKVESARLPWEQRGACNHKNENSSLHLCIAFSFSKSWVWREGGGGWGQKMKKWEFSPVLLCSSPAAVALVELQLF